MSKRALTNLVVAVVILLAIWGISQAQRYAKAASAAGKLTSQDDYEAYKAFKRVSGLGPAAAGQALKLLANPDPAVRARAALLLGESGGPGQAASVAPLLQDAEPSVRQAAAIALGDLQGREQAPALLLLASDAQQPPEVRIAAVRALGLLQSPQSAEPLGKLLEEPAPPDQPAAAALRQAAAVALGALGTADAAQILVKRMDLFQEQDAAVRALVAAALGHVSAAAGTALNDAARALMDALRNPGEVSDVKIAAAHSLGQMKLRGDMVEQAQEALREARGDDHYWVRQAAQESLQ